VFINAAERAFLGFPDDDDDDDEADLGAASLTFIHPDDHHLFTGMVDTLVQQGAGSTTVEMWIRRHDGSSGGQICSAASLGVSSVRSWLRDVHRIEDLRQQQADLTTARTQADEVTGAAGHPAVPGAHRLRPRGPGLHLPPDQRLPGRHRRRPPGRGAPGPAGA
jgi:hypothetical protein